MISVECMKGYTNSAYNIWEKKEIVEKLASTLATRETSARVTLEGRGIWFSKIRWWSIMEANSLGESKFKTVLTDEQKNAIIKHATYNGGMPD
jgi:hypothetical protein